MKKDVAEKILLETEKGYDLISGKFSQTRKNFWASLEFIGEYVKDGDKVFDFGCGNGRLFEFLNSKAKIEYWGADVSGKLIDIAKSKYPTENVYPVKSAEGGAKQFNRVNFSKLDPSQDSLAFENDFFNAAYSVAVFHHIPSKELRSELTKELFRVAKSDGYIVVTVWNLWPASTRGDNRLSTRGGQKKYFKNILENWKNKIFGKSELDWNDCHISFTDNQRRTLQRFHHAFTRRELKKIFESAGFKTKKCEVIGGRNILYIGKKK